MSEQSQPMHQTVLSAGADICASEDAILHPKQITMVKTGYRLPDDWKYEYVDMCIMLYPRSSLSYKRGLMLANSVGVIDIDYPDEIGIMLYNTTVHNVEIKAGERIAQLVMQPIVRPWEIKDAKRTGGFGSTDHADAH